MRAVGGTERCVIVGAGPAGLAAAAGAAALRPVVLDAGPAAPERSQDDPESIVQGVGGAGLYSDGKFSFWPSATALWQLEPSLLAPAYAWFAETVRRHGVDAPPPPRRPGAPPAAASPGGRHDKAYPSVYASPADRASLVDDLSSGVRVEPCTSVEAIESAGTVWEVAVTGPDGPRTIAADAVVVAAGRFGALLTAGRLPDAAHDVLRLEAGVRIEQPAHEFFLAGDPRVDPKVVWSDGTGTVQWRTFCCCRAGVVARTRSHGVLSVSGRADCAPSGRSNVGFNVRLLDPADVAREWPSLLRRLRAAGRAVTAPLPAFMSGAPPGDGAELKALLGSVLSARLAEGLALLVRDFPEGNLEGALLVGPTVEGVGMYLQHDDRLATPLPGLWVAGDAAGTFRGLTAALVSGHVAGAAASQVCR